MTTIEAVSQSGALQSFSDGTSLHNALKAGNVRPVRKDRSMYDTVYLDAEDGFLLDGAPTNVYFEGVWYEGQREVLEPYYASGQVMRPAPAAWNLPTVPMPAALQSQYAAFKEYTGQSIHPAVTTEIPWHWLIGGAALLGLFWFGGSGQSRASSDGDFNIY